MEDPWVGPCIMSAHLLFKHIIRHILQVDEHIEVCTKHTCLQGFGCHLKRYQRKELVLDRPYLCTP